MNVIRLAVFAIVVFLSSVAHSMPLTQAQLGQLKTWLSANAAGLNDEEAASALNAFPGVDYWIWDESVAESDIYDKTSDLPSDWSYATYKAQTVSEQGAWNKVVMGGNANFARRNTRAAMHAIFGGNAAGNAQRDHILAIGRRRATTAEKLFSTAVVNPPANSGNNSADARGAKTNPDEPGAGAGGAFLIGTITIVNVSEARNIP